MARLRRAIWIPVAVAVAAVAAVMLWTAPRSDVPLPGKNATPEEAVRAYMEAVNARDFDTSNAIDARGYGLDYGRFSLRPLKTEDVHFDKTMGDKNIAHVTFTATFSGGDGSMPPGETFWGYVLKRGPDGRWQIVDAGVA